MSYTLSIPTLADLPPAEALFDEVFGPGRYAKTAQRLREGRRPLFKHSRIVRIDGLTVGALLTWPFDAERLFLGPMAVRAQARGRNLGREMLQAALSEVSQPVVLIGAADYYAPFGFVPAEVSMPGPVDRSRLLLRLS